MSKITERAVEEENTVEVYESDIDLYLHLYEEEKKVKCYDINQMRWNSVLMYIYRHVFKPLDNPSNIRHRSNSTINYNEPDMINSICDHYINLCYEYGKEISIAGFSKLTGIDESTIYAWANSETRSYVYYDLQGDVIPDIAYWKMMHQGEEYRQQLSSAHSDIYKKLSNERETCLTAMTLQGNIGALAKGKIEKGWVEGSLVLHREQDGNATRTADQIASDYQDQKRLPEKDF